MDAHAEWTGDAAAYALDALGPDEAARFEDHVKTCPECRAALSEMRAAASAVPLGAPQVEAPKRLRAAVLAEVRRDARARRTPQRPGSRRWLPAPVAGAVVIAAAAVTATVLLAGGGTTVRTYAGRTSSPAATASVRVGAGTPDLIVHGLPGPPRGKVYEVWVARGGKPVATGALFDVNATGNATVAIPASLTRASAVMVTAEQRGGSKRPTSATVIDVPLS
jgi:anti-sigma-K factor RskA